MALIARLSGCSLAVLTGSLLTVFASSTYVRASSSDAWEEFQQNVEKACIAASAGALQVKSVRVDPYGSESYGFAVLSGIEAGTSSERIVVCAYDKVSETAEVSGVFLP